MFWFERLTTEHGYLMYGTGAKWEKKVSRFYLIIHPTVLNYTLVLISRFTVQYSTRCSLIIYTLKYFPTIFNLRGYRIEISCR